MMNKLIDEIIAKGVEEVNLQQENDCHLLGEDDQVIIGENGVLDSLGALVFITSIESGLKKYMPDVGLVDLFMTPESSVNFRTIGVLKRYLYGMMGRDDA